MLAGVGFGLWSGCGLCLAGSAAGAAATAALADWLAGPWFHARIEPKMHRLKWVDDRLGHNGLLTVMALRLTHLVPFGVSNVALGLSRVSTSAVAVGTLIGNVPAVAVYVGIGTGLSPPAGLAVRGRRRRDQRRAARAAGRRGRVEVPFSDGAGGRHHRPGQNHLAFGRPGDKFQ